MGPIVNSVDHAKMRRLAGDLLESTVDMLSARRCNDFKRPSYITEEEWLRIYEEYEEWNSKGIEEAVTSVDFTLAQHLANLLKTGAI